MSIINLKELLHGPRYDSLRRFTFLFVALLGLSWLAISHSWFTDDAYFSFRTVDNYVNGLGLTWNPGERVQAFTHPLWVLLLSGLYAITGEIYLTTIFVSVGLTLAVAMTLYLSIAQRPSYGLLAAFLLSLSTAFIDYSSSGLENPLSHLLLAVFLAIFLRRMPTARTLFWLSLVSALAAVNRLDTILFYLPPLAYTYWQQPQKTKALKVIALGFVPLIAWELFSLIYFGFPFPNTYYAKTQNFIPLHDLIFWGFNYFKFTARFDPITWIGILVGILGVIWLKSKRGLVVASGILLYLLYVLSIGGDFMGGRFLSSAYLAGIILILAFILPRVQPRLYLFVGPAALLISLAGSSPPYYLYSRGFEKSRLPAEGNIVTDERMEFYTTNFVQLEQFYEFNNDPEHSLINNLAFLARSVWRRTAFRWEAEHDWIRLGRELNARAESEGPFVILDSANGFTGYYAGPDVHFIQSLALTDAFLSRLPPIYAVNWRNAHFTRIVPAGYEEVVRGERQHLNDPQLDAYFQKLWLVIRGDLFTRERFQAIWELNWHGFDDYLPEAGDSFRFPALRHLSYQELLESGPDFPGIDIPGCCGLGVQIDFPSPAHFSQVRFELSGDDNFEVFFFDEDGAALGSEVLLSREVTEIEIFPLGVPPEIYEVGYSAVRLIPRRIGYIFADEEHYFYNAEFLP